MWLYSDSVTSATVPETHSLPKIGACPSWRAAESGTRDDAVRDQFFAGLSDVGNRRHEPWVIDALGYLNHPLRAPRAERYIQPSLDLLAEVNRTGDIFFPMRWMGAVLGGHSSPAAARTVVDFLERQKDYPPRLRQIVQQSSDTLLRVSRIRK